MFLVGSGSIKRSADVYYGSKPGLPPWGPHVRFRRVQTLVRKGSPLVAAQFCLGPQGPFLVAASQRLYLTQAAPDWCPAEGRVRPRRLRHRRRAVLVQRAAEGAGRVVAAWAAALVHETASPRLIVPARSPDRAAARAPARRQPSSACARRRWRSRSARPSSCSTTRTSSGSSATSIRRRRPPKLNATIGWRSSGALAMYPRCVENRLITRCRGDASQSEGSQGSPSRGDWCRSCGARDRVSSGRLFP